ncbi:hypothetical protein BSKO_09300 [Bryopsis sp. KO-2023]|nr:hypothetical protein BSKO_09300 [Bryopsis sp. KO-2023]
MRCSCEDDLHKELTVTETQRTVAEVMDTLVELLEDQDAYPGFNVAARINHGKAAETAGLDLHPTEVLIFGNPKAGTKLMQDTPSIALDLPLKIIAWRDQGDNTKVGYHNPVYLATHHCVRSDFTELLCNMAGLLENLVQLATAE